MFKLLLETSVAGLLCRIFVILVTLTLVLMLFFGLRYAECLPSVVSQKDIWYLYVLVSVTTVLGQVFSEYPQGSDSMMTRLNLTIFTRSGLLLVAVLVFSKTTKGNIPVPLVAVLMTFYSVGLFIGIYLDASRLSRQDSA